MRPMESELKSIGVSKDRALISGANVLLEFEAGFNADQALNDVRGAQISPKPTCQRRRGTRVGVWLFPIIIVTLGGGAERTLPRSSATCRKIQGISAVLEANIGGDRDERWKSSSIHFYSTPMGWIPAGWMPSVVEPSYSRRIPGWREGQFAVKVPVFSRT